MIDNEKSDLFRGLQLLRLGYLSHAASLNPYATGGLPIQNDKKLLKND